MLLYIRAEPFAKQHKLFQQAEIALAEAPYLVGISCGLVYVALFFAVSVAIAMKAHNDRIVSIDGAAVYAMLINLRDNPALYKKVLDFRPTCYQGGCGMKDAAFDAGYYGERRFPKA